MKKRGRKGSVKGSVASFANPCFDGTVGIWSARTEQKPRFLIAFLVFFLTDAIAHNPEVRQGLLCKPEKRKTPPVWVVFSFLVRV